MPNDLSAALPASVTVTFPRLNDGVPDGTLAPYVVALVSLGLPEFAGAAGFNGTKVIHSPVPATWVGGAGPTNDAQLAALAIQAATDYYRWAAARHDVVFAGVAPWVPCGLDDVVEVSHAADGVRTRAARGPWLLADAPCPPGDGGGGQGLTYVNDTFAFQNDVFNFVNGSSTWNFSVSQTVNVGGGTTYLIQGGGLLDLTLAVLVGGPLEVCGWQFWCYQNQSWTGTASVNDWDPAATGPATVFRLTADRPLTLTGVVPQNFAGAPGPQVIALVNVGGFDVTISPLDGASAAGHRIEPPGGFGVILGPGDSLVLWYDTVTALWRTLATTAVFAGTAAPIQGEGLVPTPAAPQATGCNLRYLDETGAWTAPFTGTYGGSFTVVDSLSFNATTCVLTYTTKTVTVVCGKITNVA